MAQEGVIYVVECSPDMGKTWLVDSLPFDKDAAERKKANEESQDARLQEKFPGFKARLYRVSEYRRVQEPKGE